MGVCGGRQVRGEAVREFPTIVGPSGEVEGIVIITDSGREEAVADGTAIGGREIGDIWHVSRR